MQNDCPNFAIRFVTPTVDPTEEASKLATRHPEISKSGRLSRRVEWDFFPPVPFTLLILFLLFAAAHTTAEAILSHGEPNLLEKKKKKRNKKHPSVSHFHNNNL